MILTVEEFRRYVQTDEVDQVLEAKLQALELNIREHTNNNFQVRAFRAVAVAIADGNKLLFNAKVPFAVGDTLQITDSELMPDSLVTITAVDEGSVTVAEDLFDESGVVITKVVYPMNIKMGAVDIIEWQLKNKAANKGDTSQKDVQSETISRHTKTYVTDSTEYDIDEKFGVPKKYLAFLKGSQKARFGQGVRT